MSVVAWDNVSNDRDIYQDSESVSALADGDSTEAIVNYGLGGNIQLSGTAGAGFAVALTASNDGVVYCAVPVSLDGLTFPYLLALPDAAIHAKYLKLAVSGDGTTAVDIALRLRSA